MQRCFEKFYKLKNINLPIFEYSDYCYSFYISFGYLFSLLLHIHVYHSRGAQYLLSSLKAVGVLDYLVNIIDVYSYAIVAAVIYLILSICAIKSIKNYKNISRIFSVGILISLLFSLNIQLFIVSVINFVYETFYVLIVYISLIIDSEFIHNNKSNENELWDLIKIVLPICINFPLLMAGGGLIAAFYSGERDAVQAQLYRHVGLAIYFEIGAFAYIICPIIKKLLFLRKNITYEYQIYE